MVRDLDKSAALRNHFDLAGTDAYRLVDGTGDHLPGIHIDTFAGRLLVSTLGAELPPEVREWAAQEGRSTYWKRLDQHAKSAPLHLAGPKTCEPFPVRENDLRFRISFQTGYSQGLFLDQRENRRRVHARCRVGDSILNTFAYTGAFSVCAALGGAQTTTLDLSQPYLDWARENMELNGLDPCSQHFCKGDTFHWLRRFGKQGRKFTGIVLDPPTFSRDHRGKIFRAERDFGTLVELATACLQRDGWLLCTTNCRRLPLAEFEQSVRQALPRSARLDSYPMPPDFTGEPYLKSLMAML